jgi:hypothetical protein
MKIQKYARLWRVTSGFLSRKIKRRSKKMKTRGFVVVAAFFLALAVAPAKSNAQGSYAAKLISPTAGQVVYPGQQVRVEWKTILPHVDLS